MRLNEVRTTIRDRLIVLGYEEWTGFDNKNVPETIVEKSFHVGVSGGSGSSLKMHVLIIKHNVELTLWVKGYANAVEAQDAGLESLQEVLCDLLSPVVRTLPAYRKIDLSSYTLEPITLDNDSICKVVINLLIETMSEVTQTIDETP